MHDGFSTAFSFLIKLGDLLTTSLEENKFSQAPYSVLLLGVVIFETMIRVR